MTIEYDSHKNQKNINKHGIDFQEARQFDWLNALIEEDDRSCYGETRYIALGHINKRLYVLVYTLRLDAIRIISLRKANGRERKQYEQQKH